MKIDPAAKPFTALAAVPTVIAALARRPRTTAALGLLTAGVTLFFRDPDRTPDHATVPVDDVLSPADGKVMHAGAGQDGVAPPGEWQQVSIFLSAFDVHINRTPYGGRVVEVVDARQVARGVQARERAPRTSAATSPSSVEWATSCAGCIFRQIVGLMRAGW